MTVSTQTQTHGRSVLISIAVAIGILLIVSIAFLPSAFRNVAHTRAFRMEGQSMEPALYQGDFVTADTGYYGQHPLADGDVVIFRHGSTILLKRISALPGETVEGKNGKLVRNGVPLTEPYLHDADPQDSFNSQVVPPDQVFVTGDWRARSFDSRAGEFAPVHTRDIIGKVIHLQFHASWAAGAPLLTAEFANC